jgi:hypothetical protein
MKTRRHHAASAMKVSQRNGTAGPSNEACLSLPAGGRKALAEAAWPNGVAASERDRFARDEFVKSTRRSPKGISIDEFRVLVCTNRSLVFRQLTEWGIFQKAVDWFLRPEVVAATTEWLEKQRRDLVWQNLMLTSHLMDSGRELTMQRRKGTESWVVGRRLLHDRIRQGAERVKAKYPLQTATQREVIAQIRLEYPLELLDRKGKLPSDKTFMRALSVVTKAKP